MAKPKANLNSAFETLKDTPAPAAPAPAAVSAEQEPAPRRTGRPRRTEETKLVGAQLALHYSRSLNLLSAETGKSNRELLEEALDKLFVAYAAKKVA